MFNNFYKVDIHRTTNTCYTAILFILNIPSISYFVEMSDTNNHDNEKHEIALCPKHEIAPPSKDVKQ